MKPITITVPNDLYSELWMLEVDTWEPDHPSAQGMGPGRPAFVKAMEEAKPLAKSHKVTLNEDAARYFVSRLGAVANSTDMWEDQAQGTYDREYRAQYRKFIRQAKKLDDKVRTALGEEIGSPRNRANPAPAQGPQAPRGARRGTAVTSPRSRQGNATPEQAGCVLAKHAWDRDTVECGPNAPTPAQAAQILADKRWTLPPDVRKQKARLLR